MGRKPRRSEKAPINESHLGSDTAVAVHAAAVRPVSAAPAREDPREGVIKKVQRKPEQETRQGWKRSAASAASVDNTPGTVERLESGANAARRSGEYGRSVCVPSPGYVVGPKAHHLARGVSLVDSAGSQRVRVIVVESLGSRHRTNVSVGARPAARCKARRRERCLARRKPVPGRKTFLTTRVGGDRAKTVRTFPAVANLGFREETGLEG
jgi:hypothetical protein